jgi:FMN phosphatase YigB (HAD superfamily)
MKQVELLDRIGNDDKPIALDIGNVIVKWDPEVFIKPFVNELCLIYEESTFRCDASGDVSIRITPDPVEWLNRVQPLQDLGISSIRDALDLSFPKVDKQTLDRLNDNWIKTIEFNDEMLQIVEGWIATRKVALLSNMGFQHLHYLRRRLPTIFSKTIQHISCEVGARKPMKLFYQSFMLDNPDFKSAWYLDDIEENVSMGNRYGLNGNVFHIDWII